MRLLTLLAFLVPSFAQKSIEQGYSPHDCTFVNTVPTVSLPCSADYTDNSLPIPTLRYGYSGAPLDYTISAPNGLTLVTLSFIEPNKTASNQRIFTARVNDSLPVQLDLYSLVGRGKRVDVPFVVVLDTGNVHIALRARVGNVVISAIRIDQFNFSAPSVKALEMYRCGIPITPNSDCTGVELALLAPKEGDTTWTQKYFYIIPFPLEDVVPVVTWVPR